MALRVLLADESSTIKKVFQLALQDFAVEVRPVNIGVDVAAVAKAFKPDIIFADVMLQKKNGYDVCAELKQDAQLRAIPIVLMWSGFVDLDEDKFQASHANAQLEKPFDVAALRKLVSELVPRTQSQSLAEYLTFPKARAEAEKMPELGAGHFANKSGEEFTQGPAPKKSNPSSGEKYRLNLKPEELDPSHIAVDYELPSEKINVDELFKTPEADGEEFTVRDNKKAQAKPSPMPPPIPSSAKPPPFILPDDDDDEAIDLDMAPGEMPTQIKKTEPPQAQTAGTLSAEKLEEIIRSQSAEVIESVVWKVIPELAAQIIERELNRLLKERDSNPY